MDLFDDDPLLDSLLGTELAPVHPSAPGAEPVGLESLDAVLAHLHPTSLEEMLADPVVHSPLRAPAPQAQQGAAGPAAAGSDPLSAPLSTSGDLSPELCGPAAAAAQQHAGEPVQQVPQHVQQVGGITGSWPGGRTLPCFENPTGLRHMLCPPCQPLLPPALTSAAACSALCSRRMASMAGSVTRRSAAASPWAARSNQRRQWPRWDRASCLWSVLLPKGERSAGRRLPWA